jgi:hypothetical protein
MTALSIQPSYPIFTDTAGQPLDNGYIWIGTVNLAPQTNPISIYWDAALTQTAAQPLRTSGGYIVNSGTPAVIYAASDYSILVQNSNGSAVYSSPAPTAAYGDVIINASEVVYDPAGTGAIATTVQAKLRESFSVADFGFLPTATATDNTIAFANAFAASTQLTIPAGTYNVTLLPNFGVRGTRILGIGRVVLNITGTALVGLRVDAGAIPSTAVVPDIVIDNLTINNAGSAIIGVFIRGITHSQFNRLRPINFPSYALNCQFMVSNSFYDFCYSGNEPGITTPTVIGIGLGKRNAGEQCSNCTWINPIVEGASGNGLVLDETIMNTFVGGTVEGNGYTTGYGGILIGPNNSENTFIGMDLEANGIIGDATTFHIKNAGLRTSFINVLADNTLSGLVWMYGGNSAAFHGGEIYDLKIDAGVKNTVTYSLAYGGAITNAGTDTRHIQLYNITGATTLPDSYVTKNTWTPVATNLTIVGTPTYVGTFERIGDFVSFTIRVTSTTSTAATAGTTTFSAPTSTVVAGTCVAASNVTALGFGTGLVNSNVIYVPTWAASADVVITGQYFAA